MASAAGLAPVPDELLGEGVEGKLLDAYSAEYEAKED